MGSSCPHPTARHYGQRRTLRSRHLLSKGNTMTSTTPIASRRTDIPGRGSQSSATSAGSAILNKVPEVTLFFWIIKIMCTTVGETCADFLNVDLGFGLNNTSYFMSALLLVALGVQFKAKKYVPDMATSAASLDPPTQNRGIGFLGAEPRAGTVRRRAGRIGGDLVAADRAAQQVLGSPLVRIETMGSYNCRNVAGSERRSAHATASARDFDNVCVTSSCGYFAISGTQEIEPVGDFGTLRVRSVGEDRLAVDDEDLVVGNRVPLVDPGSTAPPAPSRCAHSAFPSRATRRKGFRP